MRELLEVLFEERKPIDAIISIASEERIDAQGVPIIRRQTVIYKEAWLKLIIKRMGSHSVRTLLKGWIEREEAR